MREKRVYTSTEYACPFCDGAIEYEHYVILPTYDQEHYVCEACRICFVRNNLGNRADGFGCWSGMPYEGGGKRILDQGGIDEFEDVLRILKLRAFE